MAGGQLDRAIYSDSRGYFSTVSVHEPGQCFILRVHYFTPKISVRYLHFLKMIRFENFVRLTKKF